MTGDRERCGVLLSRCAIECVVCLENARAVIEALFKSLKVTHRYLAGGFKCIDTCRQWTQQFVPYYNGQHRHKGISWVTPEQRHDGLDVEILNGRAEVYAAARQENQSRWQNNVRQWKHIKSVTLNGQKEPNIKIFAA